MDQQQGVSPHFLQAFRGSFQGILRWNQLDALWERVRLDAPSGWYLYAVGEPPPLVPADAAQVEHFILKLDALLRQEHAESYCGIVYADDPTYPSFIKIFDPGNLGSTCGSSGSPPLPGWIMSKIRPDDLAAPVPPPRNRRRWWQSLLGGT